MTNKKNQNNNIQCLPIIFIVIVSLSVISFLIWLIYFHQSEASISFADQLPYVNAGCNALSFVFMFLGYKAIKSKNIKLHQYMMSLAMGASVLFFVSYVIYHTVHGDTKFLGEGMIRPIYFFILISHILLSMVVIPLVLTSFYFALTQKIKFHKRIVKYTLPIWMYVSVTGVLIVVFLKVWN